MKLIINSNHIKDKNTSKIQYKSNKKYIKKHYETKYTSLKRKMDKRRKLSISAAGLMGSAGTNILNPNIAGAGNEKREDVSMASVVSDASRSIGYSIHAYRTSKKLVDSGAKVGAEAVRAGDFVATKAARKHSLQLTKLERAKKRGEKYINRKVGKIDKNLYSEAIKTGNFGVTTKMVDVRFNAERIGKFNEKYNQDQNLVIDAASKGAKTVAGIRDGYRITATVGRSGLYPIMGSFKAMGDIGVDVNKLALKDAYMSYSGSINVSHKAYDIKRTEKIRANEKSKKTQRIQNETRKRNMRRNKRNANKSGKGIKGNAKSAGRKIKRSAAMIVKRVAGILLNTKVFITALIVIFMMAPITSCLSVGMNVGTVIITTLAASTYQANSADIDDAALYYQLLELEFLEYFNNIEGNFPGFDEYIIIINGSVGHNPFALIAFLTAVYEDFVFNNYIRSVLDAIFEAHYSYFIEEKMELRTRTETRTGTTTETRTGTDEDGNSYEYTVEVEYQYEVEVEYEWHILIVNLTAMDFIELLRSRMDEEQRAHFEVLMMSQGNRWYVNSPFPFNWHPYISSPYGWRIHPVTGELEMHLGVDIAQPLGTPVLSAQNGEVIVAEYADEYGNFIVIEELRLVYTSWYGSIYQHIQTRYAHLNAMFVSVGNIVEIGDEIGTVGWAEEYEEYHLHFEVVVNGRHLNPLFFAWGGGDIN